jgi:hypothetical protein
METFTIEVSDSTEGGPSKAVRVPVALLMTTLEALKPKSVDSVRAQISITDDILNSKDFWRHLHTCLREERGVTLRNPLTATVSSLAVMCGFTNVQAKDGGIQVWKPAFKSGGTLLKRKQPAENPWAALGSEESKAGIINEDELMKDVETQIGAVTGKYCGETDGIRPAKPCDNCQCGLKEIYEASLEKDAAALQ